MVAVSKTDMFATLPELAVRRKPGFQIQRCAGVDRVLSRGRVGFQQGLEAGWDRLGQNVLQGWGGGWQRAEAKVSQSGRRGGQAAQRVRGWGKHQPLPLPGQGEGQRAQPQGLPPASQTTCLRDHLINWHATAPLGQARTGPTPIATREEESRI